MAKNGRWTPWKIHGRRIGYVRGSTYYIWRVLGGKKVRISTGCVTREAADAEYLRFEMNPAGYVSYRGRRAMPKVIDPARSEQIRANRLKRAYSITPAEYDRLLALQGGQCAICGLSSAQAKNGVLDVDHDHATGEVRGLLCNPCNRGLGCLADSADLLRKAAAYLESRSPGRTIESGAA